MVAIQARSDSYNNHMVGLSRNCFSNLDGQDHHPRLDIDSNNFFFEHSGRDSKIGLHSKSLSHHLFKNSRTNVVEISQLYVVIHVWKNGVYETLGLVQLLNFSISRFRVRLLIKFHINHRFSFIRFI